MSILILIARILFAMIFLFSSFGHFTQTKNMAAYAQSKGVPFANLAVIFTGLMIFLGSISIILGAYVNVGAILIVIFTVPTAFIMHNFWTIKDPMMRQNEQLHFMKDLGLGGGAFLIWYLYSVAEVPLSIHPLL
ncbi:MAG TPA: DoxX family protein [Bacteroidota bacterium]|nr:DoxX family protein [Candidatus Kapabacteria bacterium]HRS01601.1 DoxX family protein [Bacteroidota bacterium]